MILRWPRNPQLICSTPVTLIAQQVILLLHVVRVSQSSTPHVIQVIALCLVRFLFHKSRTKLLWKTPPGWVPEIGPVSDSIVKIYRGPRSMNCNCEMENTYHNLEESSGRWQFDGQYPSEYTANRSRLPTTSTIEHCSCRQAHCQSGI